MVYSFSVYSAYSLFSLVSTTYVFSLIILPSSSFQCKNLYPLFSGIFISLYNVFSSSSISSSFSPLFFTNVFFIVLLSSFPIFCSTTSYPLSNVIFFSLDVVTLTLSIAFFFISSFSLFTSLSLI